MSNGSVTDGLLELPDLILEDLGHKNSAVDTEIARYIDLILDEFWRYYPQLRRVPELSLSLESLRNWLAQREKGGPA